jgi:hypothetical protein
VFAAVALVAGSLVAGSLVAGSLVAGASVVLAQAPGPDTIKPGKWEYTVTTRMPNMPKLPPGIQLPPNVQIQTGAGGMTIKNTSCVTSADPTAELRKPHGPRGADGQCKVEKMENKGNTVSWLTTCTTPNSTVHSEGTARYTGETMEADLKNRTSGQGAPANEVTSHVVGRYLGPCDSK